MAKKSKTQMAKKSTKVGKLGLQVCKMGLHSVQRLKGIGPKTAGALAAVQITKIDQLVKKYNQSGDTWLKNILPYGARFNVIKESISNPSSFSL
jgi:predicted flap endonuclease-1-like 5' DNA nuclease